jgi:signal transduction histidine kinase
MEALSLGLLLEDILDDCEIEASSGGCALDLEIEPNDTVVANADLLRRAIENVLRNAIRHNPVGGSIKVRATSLSDTVLVTVRDFGHGVPETELENIFEPFFRVEPDRNRETGGAGLGLAIARRAIKLHQGSVTAENADPGLIVSITLPRALSRREPTADILQARIAL